ncbi:integrase [Pantoea sp. AN62]
MKRRNFSPEFRRVSAQLVVVQNYIAAQAAKAMHVGLFTMTKWVKQLRKTPNASPVTPEQIEIREQKKKMAKSVLRRQIGRHNNWVFVHTESVKRNDGTTPASVRKMRVDSNTAWRAALKRAGIEDFRFHDLRHTWASWLIQSGVPLSALQEMGGWESIEMVRRYAHLAPNRACAQN